MRAVARTRSRLRAGFTLLEVLVATMVMAVAVVGLLSSLTTSMRGAARLTDVDRAAMLAKDQMQAILVDPQPPMQGVLNGVYPADVFPDHASGWTATLSPFEMPPTPTPLQPYLQRVQLQIWWSLDGNRRTFNLDGYRRALIPPQ